MSAYRVTCTDCGWDFGVITPPSTEPEPCPVCKSIGRTIHIEIHESVTVRDGWRMKGKEPGKKKPFLETRSEPSHSHKLGKHVHHERVIDRRNDQYFEQVTDYESGEVLHHCNEALSDHTWHGSAKPKSPEEDGSTQGNE